MKWILALSVFVISFTVTLGAFSSRDYSQSAQNTTNQAQTSDLGNVSGVASSSTEVLAVNTSVNALYLSPETQNVPVGQTFQVQVKLNAVTNVNAVEANISYPTNRLTVQSISNGSFGIEAAKTFSNGNINLAYGNISPLTGDILVATITFQTTSAGTANVTFGNSTVASSATNQNVLQETNNATYTVGTTATSTPTPIPPTPTPTGTQNPQDDIFPWIPTDIGSPLQGGQTKVSDGNYNIIGSGADIWFANDSFRYAYQARTGDFTLTTQVTGLTNTDQWAKAGLMIRESSAANSKYAFVFVTPGTNGVNFEYRNSTGANSAQSGTISGVSSIPTWLRITKTGNSFTAFRSTNGTTWTQQGSPVTISMATTLAGMAVTSHDASAFATGQFRNLAFSAVVTPTIPPTATPTPPPSATPTPSATSIRFSGPTTVANGQTFDVQVRVNASQTVNAVETNVTFPSNLIDALSVSNAGGGFEVEASKAITSGNVNLAYGTTTPKSGDVLVATITFRAKAVGSANFTHQNAQVISNVTNQNVLGSVQNGGLTITSSTTPTVQPTATTAPSPTPTRTPTPTLAPSPTVQPKNAALSFSPATSSVANGANFTVQVRVNSPQSINALETNVTFPTALLNVVSISNSGGGFEVEASKTISGNTINLANGTTTPKTGNQLVATITFQAKAAGTAALAHTNAVVLSSITNKDVLGSVTGGSYTITAVSTPTPTPTRTPTPSPTLTSTPTISPTTVPGGTILSFNPTSGTFNNNSEFDVQVRLAADENVNAIETNVTFPTSLLEVVSISKEGGAFDVEASKTVNGGTINLAYGSTTPRTGNQLVTTIKFRAKAVGIADIRHTNAQVLSSATNQNVLDNVAPVSYTITASVTPSISISPTGLTCDPNNDGIINIVDFQWWKDEYFKVRTTTISDCFNPNGKVDLLDFQGWKDRFFGN